MTYNAPGRGLQAKFSALTEIIPCPVSLTAPQKFQPAESAKVGAGSSASSPENVSV